MTQQPKSRLTVVGSVYHQSGDEQPTACSVAYARSLDSLEQPYGPRKMGLTDKWVPLDLGWLEGHAIALLVLHHVTPTKSPTQPTIEETEVRSRVRIEVGILLPQLEEPTPLFLLGVGETTSVRPTDPGKWVVRSVGKGKLSVTAFGE